VFISYRRADHPLFAHVLQRELAGRFGEESIFLDNAIRPGDDYVRVLQDAVGSCQVLVAVIGPQWLTMQHAEGGRRLDREDDWVRIEIVTALRRGVRVIPVLVAGAVHFSRDELPPDLAPLADRQTLVLDVAGLDEGLGRLADAIAGAIEPEEEPISELVSELVRRARLLKAEAEELQLAHVRGRVPRGGGEVRFDEVFADFDHRPATSKLREAFGLLEQANRHEPTHTEVLLLMADLLVHLTPDDPTDEQELAGRVMSLLSSPKDDQDRFRLARATFLLGVSGDRIHPDMVRDARRLFEQVGRQDWVRQCTDVLAAHEPGPPGPQPPPGPPPPRPQGFVPLGRWQVRDMAPVASTLTADFVANGMFQGRFQAPGIGIDAPAQGQWAYNAVNRAFQVQGVAGGFMPLNFLVFVQGQGPQGWYGTGSDGVGYVFTPAG